MPPGARGCDQEALELPQVLMDLHSPQEVQPEGGSRQGPQGLSCLGPSGSVLPGGLPGPA